MLKLIRWKFLISKTGPKPCNDQRLAGGRLSSADQRQRAAYQSIEGQKLY